VLPPNGPMVYGLDDVNGYDSLFPAEIQAYLTQIEGRDPSPLANGNMILMQNVDSPLLDRTGCEYVMTLRQLTGPKWTLLDSNGTVNVYRNGDAWPRAYTIGPGETDPRACAVACFWHGPNAVFAHGEAKWPQLVVSDTWYPGWKASDDERPVPVERQDGIFQRVAVRPGECRVLFVYYPSSFLVGLFLALVGLAVCAGWAAATWPQRKGTHKGCPYST